MGGETLARLGLLGGLLIALQTIMAVVLPAQLPQEIIDSGVYVLNTLNSFALFLPLNTMATALSFVTFLYAGLFIYDFTMWLYNKTRI